MTSNRYIEIFKSSPQEYQAVLNFNSKGFHHSPNYGHHDPREDAYFYGHDHNPFMDYPFPRMRYNPRPSPYDRFGPAMSRSIPPYGYGMAAGMGNRGPPPGAIGRRPPTAPWDYPDMRRGGPVGPIPPYPGRFAAAAGYGPSPSTYFSAKHLIHMRGLPFRASERDIMDFFHPHKPIRIRLLLDQAGRSSGEADVAFGSHQDASRAMAKDKEHMDHRYIELFLHSSPGPGGSPTDPHEGPRIVDRREGMAAVPFGASRGYPGPEYSRQRI